MKIAIVDDDSIFHFITQKTIEKIAPEHEILHFDNGREAFDYIKSNLPYADILPELILLDINMPLMNGWQFLDNFKNLKTAAYRPTIYIVSSSSAQTDISKAQTYAELNGYLTKPLSRHQLLGLFAT